MGSYNLDKMKRYKDSVYFISMDGNIFNSFTEKYIKHYDNGRGYRKTTLTVNGSSIQRNVHRLVAESWIPNPENKPQVNHKDGNKSNNHIDNLEWNTNKENIRHSHNTGLNKSRMFTLMDINSIKKSRESGLTFREIASIFNTSCGHIHDVISGRVYDGIC